MGALVDGIDAVVLLGTPRLPMRSRLIGLVAGRHRGDRVATAQRLADARGAHRPLTDPGAGVAAPRGLGALGLAGLEGPLGVTPVDVADERRVDAVAEQLAEPLRDGARLVGRDREQVGLLGSEPAGAVLDRRRRAVTGRCGSRRRRARATRRRASPTRRASRPGRRRRRGVGPVERAVAAGDQAGGAVRGGEVVEGPHHVHDELGVRSRHRVDVLVAVQHLLDLAGADLDAGRAAELVVRPEHVVDGAER